MKSSLTLIFFGLFMAFSQAQKMKVDYTFNNIRTGQDHPCRMVVYVDGKQDLITSTHKQSKGGSFKGRLPQGVHDVRIVNEILRDGKWEEHTVKNGYAYDFLHDFKAELSKKSKLRIKIVFDADEGNAVNASVKATKIL